MAKEFGEQTLVNKVLSKIAAGVLIEERIDDKEIIAQRRAICLSPCDFYDKKNIMCKKCGCFLIEKVESLININIHTGKSEVTHCPMNFWEDEFSKSFFKIKDNDSAKS